MAESMYDIIKKHNVSNEFFELFNYEEVGGSPIVGVNGNVIIGHGASSPKSIKSMMIMAYKLAENKISQKIKEAYA